MEKELREQVREFSKRIAKVYSVLDWTWLGNEDSPTKEEISDTLLQLYASLRENKESTETSTGGLYFKREDGMFTFGMDIHGSYVKEI